MSFTKQTWTEDVTPTSAANMQRFEDALADLYNIAYAEDLSEAQLTSAGTFLDPSSGAAGPTVTVTIPTGGRFVDLAAECEAHHSANNTNAIFFVLAFSSDGGATFQNMPTVYSSAWPYDDTGAGSKLAYGAAMDFADTSYRPLRLGSNRTPNGDATGTLPRGSHTRIFLPAGAWSVRMRYGIKAGGSGTAYFKSRRLQAQVLAH